MQNPPQPNPSSALNEENVHILMTQLRLGTLPFDVPKTAFGKHCVLMGSKFQQALADHITGHYSLNATEFKAMLKQVKYETQQEFTFPGAPQEMVDDALFSAKQDLITSQFMPYMQAHGDKVVTDMEGTPFFELEAYIAQRSKLVEGYRASGAVMADKDIHAADVFAQYIYVAHLEAFAQELFNTQWVQQYQPPAAVEQPAPAHETPTNVVSEPVRQQDVVFTQMGLEPLKALLMEYANPSLSGNAYKDKLIQVQGNFFKRYLEMVKEHPTVKASDLNHYVNALRLELESDHVAGHDAHEIDQSITQLGEQVGTSQYAEYLSHQGLFDADDNIDIERYAEHKEMLDEEFITAYEQNMPGKGWNLAQQEIHLFELSHHLQMIVSAYDLAIDAYEQHLAQSNAVSQRAQYRG